MRAIIPAAGLGTRMRPITRSVPKEMLPVGRKPMIQHVVEEAVLSGLREICIVIREGKEVIRDYFSPGRDKKERSGDGLDELRELVTSCELTFLYQERPLGLGDSLLQAKDFVGRESFLMLIPDQLMRARVPAARQLIERAAAESAAIWTSLIRLPKAEVPLFAGARGFEFEKAADSDTLRMGRIRTEEETRSAFLQEDYELRGFGRTIYPPEIFDYLGEDFVNPRTGEVDLLKTFERCAGHVIPHRGLILEGEAFDMGTFESYYHYLPRFVEMNV